MLGSTFSGIVGTGVGVGGKSGRKVVLGDESPCLNSWVCLALDLMAAW